MTYRIGPYIYPNTPAGKRAAEARAKLMGEAVVAEAKPKRERPKKDKPKPEAEK